VDVASIHLVGRAATWFASYIAVRKYVDWTDFILDIYNRFKDERGSRVIEDFHKLHQTEQNTLCSRNHIPVDTPQVLDKSPKSNPDISSHGWVGEGQGKSPMGSYNAIGERLKGLNPSNGLLEKSLSSIHDKDSDLCVQEEISEDDQTPGFNSAVPEQERAVVEEGESVSHSSLGDSVGESIETEADKIGDGAVKATLKEKAEVLEGTNVGVDPDAHIDLHELGMKLCSEALEETVTSEEAQLFCDKAALKFQDVTDIDELKDLNLVACWISTKSEANGFYSFVFDPGTVGVGQSSPQPKPLAFTYARLVEILATSKVSVVIFVFDPREEMVTALFSSDPGKLVSWHTSAQVIAEVAGIKVPRAEWPARIGSLLNNMTQADSSASLKQATLDALGDVYPINPRMEQYACVVSMLGRARLFPKAQAFVDKLSVKPGIFVWQVLLGACASHGDSVLGQYAAAQLLLLAPEFDPGKLGVGQGIPPAKSLVCTYAWQVEQGNAQQSFDEMRKLMAAPRLYEQSKKGEKKGLNSELGPGCASPRVCFAATSNWVVYSKELLSSLLECFEKLAHSYLVDGAYGCCSLVLDLIKANRTEWSKRLPLAEWWYNTSFHSSIELTPLLSSVHLPYIPGEPQVEAVDRTMQRREAMTMKMQANHHRSEREFSVGNWLWLKLQPYRQPSLQFRINQKLAPKFYGLSQVEAKIGQVGYKLKLSAAAHIHPTFHVFQLEEFHGVLPWQLHIPHWMPDKDAHMPLPFVAVLDSKLVKRGNRAAVSSWYSRRDNLLKMFCGIMQRLLLVEVPSSAHLICIQAELQFPVWVAAAPFHCNILPRRGVFFMGGGNLIQEKAGGREHVPVMC